MTRSDRSAYWEDVYRTRGSQDVSWFQPEASMSLRLIEDLAISPSASVIDIGGGASTLVDGLLARGHGDLAVLDLSEAALMDAQTRLGESATAVEWIVADLTSWSPHRRYSLWHDRAVLHFLTAEPDRSRYAQLMAETVDPGGLALIGTFSHNGPEQCSGLPVRRYSAEEISDLVGPEFTLADDRSEVHPTPAGTSQQFAWAALRRR